MTSYLVPASDTQAEIEIKKSRFIALCRFVETQQEAKIFVQQCRRQYDDARHVCWAMLLGNPQTATHAASNDDGEPSGTAGLPILNVIQHKSIGDIVIVVVRYFGGIKLGAGGLARAYSEATEKVLASTPLKQRVFWQCYTIHCGFDKEQYVRHLIEQHQGVLQQVSYQEEVNITLSISEDQFNNFRAKLVAQGMDAKSVDT